MPIHKKRENRGRKPEDRVPPDIAEAFRAKIREGMARYGATTAADVVQHASGTRQRDPKWVWLQLSPSRHLHEHNARELFFMLINCAKAIDYRIRANGVDEWLNTMLRDVRFSFLRMAPQKDAPPPILFSPTSIDEIADALAIHLDGPNSKLLQKRIKSWLLENGGQSGWRFGHEAARQIAWRYRSIKMDDAELDFHTILATLHTINDSLWQDNEKYEEFREELRKEHENP